MTDRDLETHGADVEAGMSQAAESGPSSPSSNDRFDSVDAALVEQRQYTEFAFHKLERRFEQADRRFEQIDRRFEQIDRRFERIESELAGVRTDVRTVSSGLGRLERKLDQFIDRFTPPPAGPMTESPT